MPSDREIVCGFGGGRCHGGPCLFRRTNSAPGDTLPSDAYVCREGKVNMVRDVGEVNAWRDHLTPVPGERMPGRTFSLVRC